MSSPPSRNDYAGSLQSKVGQTAMMLPTQSLDDDVYIEMVPFRREQFELTPFLSPHPRSPEHLLVKQEPLQGDNNEVYIRQTYSRLVGKALTGSIVSDLTQGTRGETSSQRVPTGSQPEEGFGVLESSVVPQDANTALAQTVRVAEFPELTTHRLDPDGWGAMTEEKVQTVPVGTEPEAGGMLVIDSAVASKDKHHAVKQVKTVSEWPVLIGSHVDEQTGIRVDYEKSVVPAGTKGGVVGRVWTEVKEWDKWRSISIASKVDLSSLPGPMVFPRTETISLPDMLVSIGVDWSKVEGGGGATQGGSNRSAAASASADVNGAIIIQTRAGYQGPCLATLTRSFHSAMPSSSVIPTPTIIKPSTGTAYILSKGESKSQRVGDSGGEFSYRGATRSQTRTVGPILTGGFALPPTTQTATSTATASSPGGGVYPAVEITANATATLMAEIPSSIPEVFAPGASILRAAHVERWRFDIFVMEVLTLTLPDDV